MRKLFILLMVPFFAMAQKEEIWKLEIPSQGGKIPVQILLDGDGKAYALNADEKLEFDRVYNHKDTLNLIMSLYDLELSFVKENNTLKGFLSKRMGDMLFRQAPFTGVKETSSRFPNPKKLTPSKLGSKYQLTFKNATTEKESPSLGVFEVTEGKVKGTFLSTTGDSRYLQGNVIGDSLFLSSLGYNAYLYKAKIKGDSLVGGALYTPFDKSSTFSGIKNDKYELPDASKLTYLKEGYNKFDFSFPNLAGDMVSLSHARFKGKVTVVQILGTWCPNCMDESKFLMEYKKNNPGIEIIGLAFERSLEPNYVYPKIGRFIERFHIDYPVLLAGKIEEASEKLPQLNKVMSFPTSIIVDKKGVVRKIHTGFTGPSTGAYYEDYVKEFSELVEKLKAE